MYKRQLLALLGHELRAPAGVVGGYLALLEQGRDSLTPDQQKALAGARKAQQALAIVIRTFAAANRHRHRAEGYDLCDTTHCQVMRPVLSSARDAAQATAGQILLDKGAPAFVFYSAHNGGTPALASEVWPGAHDGRHHGEEPPGRGCQSLVLQPGRQRHGMVLSPSVL